MLLVARPSAVLRTRSIPDCAVVPALSLRCYCKATVAADVDARCHVVPDVPYGSPRRRPRVATRLPSVRGTSRMNRPLRIAHVAPPLERVPPLAYGGTERIIFELVDRARPSRPRDHHLRQRRLGRPGRLIPTVDEALRPSRLHAATRCPTCSRRCARCSTARPSSTSSTRHLEWASLLLARVSPVPVVSTFHGRLDLPWAAEALRDPPARARRHQREPGIDPPRRALDRSSTTA